MSLLADSFLDITSAPFNTISTMSISSSAPSVKISSHPPSPTTTIQTDDPLLSAALNLDSRIIEKDETDCVEAILAALDAEAPTRGPFPLADVEQLCKDIQQSTSWSTARRNASASPPRRPHTPPSDASSSRLRRSVQNRYSENGNWEYEEDCTLADVFTSIDPDRQREEMKKRLPGRRWSDVCKRFRVICGEVQQSESTRPTIQKRLPCGTVITIAAPTRLIRQNNPNQLSIQQDSNDTENDENLTQQQKRRRFLFWKPKRTTEGRLKPDFRIGKRMSKFR